MLMVVTWCLWRTGLVALLFCCSAKVVWASEESTNNVLIRQSNIADINNEDYYFYRLLELVLRKTDAPNEFTQVKQLPYRLEDRRLRSSLMQGSVDVLWSPTSAEFERQMLPVKISLLKDLNNYRLFLIRKNEQARFSAVHSLEDLRQLKGGMSPQWIDARIMKYNNLPLVEAVGYSKLFKMLAAKRFDYFSRGLYQIYSEVNFYPEYELQIEKELMLHYQNPVYFFVNKNNTALAQRLKTGLEIAQRDGSFDELFNSIPRYRWGTEVLQTHKRRVFELLPLPGSAPAADD